MKKAIIPAFLLMSLMMAQFSFAVSTGTTIGINVSPGNSDPQVFQNTGARQLKDVFNNPLTRTNNYAFTGEKIIWQVLVRDGNGKEDISKVEGTVGLEQGSGNPSQVSCIINSQQPNQGDLISWASGLAFDTTTDVVYNCTLTVEPSFNGEYWTQVVATDKSNAKGNVRENSFFWFNPSIGLQILDAPNGLIFTETGKPAGTVSPGSTGYSQTIRLKSVVASGSGVILDVDIKGSDFYDPASSSARCPTTNQLALSNFRYYASKGSYSTQISPSKDTEGYDLISYNYRNLIYGGSAEASRLSEGSEAMLTFKLNLPKPCFGAYSTSSNGFSFEGTAI